MTDNSDTMGNQPKDFDEKRRSRPGADHGRRAITKPLSADIR